ncbi:DUF5047 domain-containing protein [Streptomyces sp. NPDC046332]
MVLPTTAVYQAVLRQPHKRFARVDVTDIDGVPRASLLRPLAGSVTASLTQRVTRSATFSMPFEFYPATADDVLSPEHAVVHIRAGIEYGDGSVELFPLFVGRVTDAVAADDGSVDFTCDDLAQDVIGYRFEQPRTTAAPTTLAEIESLIIEALPQATFGTHTVTDQPTPTLTWDEDRGQALDDLANSLGGRWYALGNGNFVVRPFNYTLGTVAQTMIDGPGGLLTTATVGRSRAGAANSVVVVSERPDGTPPIRVPARIISPADPLFFGGKFGRMSQIIKVNTPLSATQAQVLAQTQLAAAASLAEQWAVTVVPDHSLEPGDTVDLGHRSLAATQIIDSITYPLGTTEDMAITTRAGTA